ncbi:MAG TPA: ABC transporter ATP-binding protein [Candidatus Dormibacteraeota bacterium]|nr:ABC transporter ATP-binding protein [Candidatus Dormibacteraeota bacterium]
MSILECQQVSKAYGGLLAVNKLSFAVEPGEVYAIVGPNGAGKTSLFDCISGVSRATTGVIRFREREIQALRAHQICRLGLARTFQTTVAFDSQTVLTNVLVGSTFGLAGANPFLSFDDQAVEAALDALALCGLAGQQRALASQLPVLARKRLMLATALATRPGLLMLDEPFGGLNPGERVQMIDLIRDVARAGVTVLMIEHVMKAVQALADRLLVMDHGQEIAQGPPATVLRDPRVIEVYLGMLRPLGPDPETAHA